MKYISIWDNQLIDTQQYSDEGYTLKFFQVICEPLVNRLRYIYIFEKPEKK